MARLPASCRPRGRGWSAAVACVLEASAPKPGNVHPGADFPDLSYDELVAAGLAIAPVLEQAPSVPLGRTILAAATASREATRSNANLGIILAMAPLAAVPDDPPVSPAADGHPSDAAVAGVFARLSAHDAADVWEAIRIARPGGLGRAGRHDVAGPPPTDLLEAMRLAAPRDAIARLWARGYRSLHEGLVADLAAASAGGLPLDDAIVRAFLAQLARQPDSLIARKHGTEAAADVSRRAAKALIDPARIAGFDRFLRSPRRLNPGTTADLTATALYILVRDGRLPIGAGPGLHGFADRTEPPVPS